jgi:hypothetical protein
MNTLTEDAVSELIAQDTAVEKCHDDPMLDELCKCNDGNVGTLQWGSWHDGHGCQTRMASDLENTHEGAVAARLAKHRLEVGELEKASLGGA